MQLHRAGLLRLGSGDGVVGGGLEVVLVGLALELGEDLVDPPAVAVEIGEHEGALGAAQLAAGPGEAGLGLVEQTPEARDPRRTALVQIVGLLGGRTTVEMGLDQTIELARCQDGPVGAGNGVLLRQAKQGLREEAFRIGTTPSSSAGNGA